MNSFSCCQNVFKSRLLQVSESVCIREWVILLIELQMSLLTKLELSLNAALIGNSIQQFKKYSQDKKKVRKGNNSVISLNRDMVLVHCTLSHCSLPLKEVLLNSIRQFSSYLQTNKTSNKMQLLCNQLKQRDGSCTLPFLSLCSTIVFSFIKFHPYCFKVILWTRKK